MAVLDSPLFGSEAFGGIKHTLEYHTRGHHQHALTFYQRQREPTPSQLEWRDLFRTAVQAWRDFPQATKDSYNAQATPPQTGFNLWLSEALMTEECPPCIFDGVPFSAPLEIIAIPTLTPPARNFYYRFEYMNAPFDTKLPKPTSTLDGGSPDADSTPSGPTAAFSYTIT